VNRKWRFVGGPLDGQLLEAKEPIFYTQEQTRSWDEKTELGAPPMITVTLHRYYRMDDCYLHENFR
jgi:hypothetical protein